MGTVAPKYNFSSLHLNSHMRTSSGNEPEAFGHRHVPTDHRRQRPACREENKWCRKEKVYFGATVDGKGGGRRGGIPRKSYSAWRLEGKNVVQEEDREGLTKTPLQTLQMVNTLHVPFGPVFLHLSNIIYDFLKGGSRRIQGIHGDIGKSGDYRSMVTWVRQEDVNI